jgi:uncharacterized membrane protein
MATILAAFGSIEWGALTGYLPVILLLIALVAAGVWAQRVWTDVKGEGEEVSTDPDDLLGPLSEAFAAGQMSEEEYLRIRESIGRGGRPGQVPARPEVVPSKSGTPDADPPGDGPSAPA